MKKIQRQQPAQGWMLGAVAVLALMKALDNWADARVTDESVSD